MESVPRLSCLSIALHPLSPTVWPHGLCPVCAPERISAVPPSQTIRTLRRIVVRSESVCALRPSRWPHRPLQPCPPFHWGCLCFAPNRHQLPHSPSEARPRLPTAPRAARSHHRPLSAELRPHPVHVCSSVCAPARDSPCPQPSSQAPSPPVRMATTLRSETPTQRT